VDRQSAGLSVLALGRTGAHFSKSEKGKKIARLRKKELGRRLKEVRDFFMRVG